MPKKENLSNLSEKNINEFEIEIGRRLVYIRKIYFNNISQKELGAKIFNSEPQNTMSRIEHCKGSIRTMLQLFKYYNDEGIDLNAIFDDLFKETNIFRLDNIKRNSEMMQSLCENIDQAMKNFMTAKGHMDLLIRNNINFLQEFREKIILKEVVESVNLDIQSDP